MAVYNELQVGRYVRFLQKFLGIKGRQPAPLTFSGELGATWGLFHGVENRYLEGWNRFAIFLQPTGGGVSPAAVRLRNPLNSSVVAVLEKMTVGNLVADQPLVQLTTTSTDLPAGQLSTNLRLDARGNPTPSLITSASTAFPHAGTPNLVAFLAANSNYDFIQFEEQEIPILPGDAVTVQASGVSAALNVSFMWRERVLEEGELK